VGIFQAPWRVAAGVFLLLGVETATKKRLPGHCRRQGERRQ